jgi:hypothetical protein
MVKPRKKSIDVTRPGAEETAGCERGFIGLGVGFFIMDQNLLV